MKIACAQLQSHLRSKPAALYLISGDEPFLAQEAAGRIREAAEAAGYSDRTRIATDTADWINALWTATHSLSLLSPKCLIEIDLRGMRLTPTHAKTLNDMVSTLPPSIMLILLAKRPDGRGAPPAWQTACEKAGVIVPVWPIKGDQLPQWILQRAKTLQIPLSQASARWLAEQTEGNLSAAAQELEKLTLWLNDETMTETSIDQSLREMITSNARYDIFQLSDAVKSRNSLRAVSVLSRLMLAGTEPALILWAITRELRTMTGRDRHSDTPTSLRLLPFAARIDRMIKGAEKGCIQDEMQALLLMMAGNPLPRTPSTTGKTA